MHLNLISGAEEEEEVRRRRSRGGLVTPFATATPTEQPASQASQRRRRHHGCTVVAVTTAIIRTRHTRALRQTLFRRGCGHLAPLTNRPPPRPTPSLQARPASTGDIILNYQLSEDFGYVPIARSLP